MKEFTIKFFACFGCSLQDEGDILAINLTPELAEYFGKQTLQLVFQPEHVSEQTELITPGSYLSHRMYDLVKQSGRRVSIILPNKQQAVGSTQQATSDSLPIATHSLLAGINCAITKQRVKEIRKTEAYLIFRMTYHSDEKVEEIITVGVDFEGKLSIRTEFPYSPDTLKDVAPGRFPFTKKQAKAIYDQCLTQVSLYAEQRAATYQAQAAEHFHANITRLEAFYHQMIEEVPILEKNRDAAIRQLQDEYDIKAADELKKYQMQVAITPVSFCAITVPFIQHQYTLEVKGEGQKAKRKRQNAKGEEATTFRPSPFAFRPIIKVYHNLFSGEWIYPRCEVCGREMKQIGICEAKSHPVCAHCLVQCHECGAYICRDCGIEVCFECGEWVCHQCSHQCHVCGERYCNRHLLGCVICREHFCTQCAEPCEVCGKLVEKTHLTACEISYKLACPGCIGVCSCCRKSVCQSLLKTCAFCGQNACSDCTFRCDVCHETFCVHHITECDITKKMVCARHSGTCERCARHVSTKRLHKCDVCGKKICTLCSTECSRCHTVFCKDDAEDMMPCPECGQIYCALCYTDHACHGGQREI
jgi:hypothetical protein